MKVSYWVLAFAAGGIVLGGGVSGAGLSWRPQSAAAQNVPDASQMMELFKQSYRKHFGREPTAEEIAQAEKGFAALQSGGVPASGGPAKSSAANSAAVPKGKRIVKGVFKHGLENGPVTIDTEDSFEVVAEVDKWGGLVYSRFEDSAASAESTLKASEGAGTVVNHASKWKVHGDERTGCPAPKLQGSVEALTIHKANVSSRFLSLSGTQSVPAVAAGKGRDACSGADTETLSEEPRELYLNIEFEREQLAESAAKTVTVKTHYPSWTVTIGPYSGAD
jgi:hypothetical protein